MRIWKIASGLVFGYLFLCFVLGIFLAQLAFQQERLPTNEVLSTRAAALRFGAPLQEVAVRTRDGVRLNAWFVQPTNANGSAVILLHGLGDSRQGMMGFAQLFLSSGYAVLTPDSRAHGTSGGAFPTYGIKEAGDVELWYQWLENYARPQCIFGMGESMGAAIVLQTVRTTPFCAVIAESAFASFRQIAFIRVGQMFHTGDWLGKIALRPAVEFAFLYGRISHGVNLAAASPQHSVEGSRVPILLIHGLADSNIPTHESEIIQARNPTDIALWEVPNAGHCGAVNAAPKEFERRVLGWFADHNIRSQD